MLWLLLAVEWEQREIPWAGIAAALAGTGSLLTGIAAMKSAKKEGRDEAKTIKEDRTAGD
jgi:hypothetical protein